VGAGLRRGRSRLAARRTRARVRPDRLLGDDGPGQPALLLRSGYAEVPPPRDRRLASYDEGDLVFVRRARGLE
jgi:hypothetical protein